MSEIEGDEYLYYLLPKANISLIRVTTADTNGNCTIEDEILPLDMLSAAMAAKGCGGKVIVQAKNIVAADTIPSRQVAIPGIFVDAIVGSGKSGRNTQTVRRFLCKSDIIRCLQSSCRRYSSRAIRNQKIYWQTMCDGTRSKRSS